MTDRLLRKCDIASMLGTSPGVAASILSENGCYPIDFGYGRGRGPRWLESAVRAVIQALHRQAQPQTKQPKNRKPKIPQLNLADMKVSDLHELLTMNRPVQ